MSDPAAWAGLATLIVLEIVLGIDNLVFIAILADKLQEHQREKARLIGLGLAFGMRLILLASIAWIVTLTSPLFTFLSVVLSGRDLILIFGGVFLLFKGTMELHERLEGHTERTDGPVEHAILWQVLVQIVVLDAVFSLDSSDHCRRHGAASLGDYDRRHCRHGCHDGSLQTIDSIRVETSDRCHSMPGLPDRLLADR